MTGLPVGEDGREERPRLPGEGEEAKRALDDLRRLVRMTVDEDQHECRGLCPDDDMPDVRDPDCLACALIDFPEASA